MSSEYVLITDSSSDLPADFLNEHEIPYVQLSYNMNGVDYTGDELPPKEFYQRVREGEMPITAQVNQQVFKDLFTQYLEQGKDILYIAFSSGLSGTCASGQAAARELSEEYPDRKIYVVDSLCASLGQGLLVYKCLERKEQGATIEEVKEYAENNCKLVGHSFTVEDLMHLHRGGRVSKTAAVAGSLLGIKPALHVDDAGHLIPLNKVRGRKASLDRVVEQMKEWVGDTPNDIFMISHGDDEEAAEYVAQRVKEEFGIEKSLINFVGPVIGAHSGPGTIALFMMTEGRQKSE